MSFFDRLMWLVGIFHATAFMLGSVGVLDYHVCLKAPEGLCTKEGK
jgi:hypothetical protein